MTQPTATSGFVHGLAGVLAAQSKVGFVDGEKGILEYRGIPIEKLAERSTFEETTYLLLYDKLPTRAQLTEFSASLASYRAIRPEIVQMITAFPRDGHPMAALQTTVAAMGLYRARARRIRRSGTSRPGASSRRPPRCSRPSRGTGRVSPPSRRATT
jgi:citrate synthase